MEFKHGGRLPEWRYRAMYGQAADLLPEEKDAFEARAEARLAAERLPWCFGEMNYPHWRAIPITAGDPRMVSYYAGDDAEARDAALSRLLLCARCPVFDRCHKVTMAKKSASPSSTAAARKGDMLAALSRR